MGKKLFEQPGKKLYKDYSNKKYLKVFIVLIVMGLLTFLIETLETKNKLKEVALKPVEKIESIQLPYEILEKYVIHPTKYSLTLLVYPEDERFPGSKSLQKIALKIKNENPNFKNYYIHFMLPEMIMDNGAYAIANDTEFEENMFMEVKILKENLYNTKYEKYLKFDNEGNYLPLPFYEK